MNLKLAAELIAEARGHVASVRDDTSVSADVRILAGAVELLALAVAQLAELEAKRG